MWVTAASNDKVSAMPASSMITSVSGPRLRTHLGTPSFGCANDHTSFANVSAVPAICSPNPAAAAAHAEPKP